MAKTRIKTTPTRMQKEALMASAAVTTTTNIVTEHVFKKRLSVLKNSITSKEPPIPVQSTIIVQPPPKRTNSISSATSTISHTSDGRSCNESPTPPANSAIATTKMMGPTMAELTENAIKTLNAGLLAKSNALALKNRKVYMITERCDDETNGTNSNGGGTAGGAAGGMGQKGQKRKMYLIMEEKESDNKNGENTEKLMKTENSNTSKKLTLFTDTTNGQLPQKFEKILPEILNCIQANKAGGVGGGGGVVSGGLGSIVAINDKSDTTIIEMNNKAIITTNGGNKNNTKLPSKSEDNERLPLTLPPKKNRTKIITTQIIPVNPSQTIYNTNGIESVAGGGAGVVGGTTIIQPAAYATHTNSNGFAKSEKSSATPVIVNATTLMSTNGNGCLSKENSNNSNAQLHKNINLSTDFLFLMKMLPKLESIEEPHKNYVKNCIEDIINQYAANHLMDQ